MLVETESQLRTKEKYQARRATDHTENHGLSTDHRAACFIWAHLGPSVAGLADFLAAHSADSKAGTRMIQIRAPRTRYGLATRGRRYGKQIGKPLLCLRPLGARSLRVALSHSKAPFPSLSFFVFFAPWASEVSLTHFVGPRGRKSIQHPRATEVARNDRAPKRRETRYPFAFSHWSLAFAQGRRGFSHSTQLSVHAVALDRSSSVPIRVNPQPVLNP